MINQNLQVDSIKKRMRCFHNLTKLREMVLRNSISDEEKFIGLSYAYLGLVDGIYMLSLRDCFLWHKLANQDHINTGKIQNMDPSGIYDYFSKKKFPLFYFDGWDKTVRNAVTRSSFHFDFEKQKMIYEDWNKTSKTSTISGYFFNEMVENYDKLESLYYAILVINQLTNLNDTILTFSNRYKS